MTEHEKTSAEKVYAPKGTIEKMVFARVKLVYGSLEESDPEAYRTAQQGALTLTKTTVENRAYRIVNKGELPPEEHFHPTKEFSEHMRKSSWLHHLGKTDANRRLEIVETLKNIYSQSRVGGCPYKKWTILKGNQYKKKHGK